VHPTTAQYLIQARQRDLDAEAANARLVAEVREHESREHDSDELRPTRWGIRLPRLVPAFRRGPAVGTTTP
jgi:hypothetical protein